MSEFKVGDRVRLTDEKQAQPGVLGTYSEGTVESIGGGAYPIEVRFDKVTGHEFFGDVTDAVGDVAADEIQLVESA